MNIINNMNIMNTMTIMSIMYIVNNIKTMNIMNIVNIIEIMKIKRERKKDIFYTVMGICKVKLKFKFNLQCKVRWHIPQCKLVDISNYSSMVHHFLSS